MPNDTTAIAAALAVARPEGSENAGDFYDSDVTVAAMIGCSRPHVWRLVKQGILPAPRKIGRMTRWKRAEWVAAIDVQTQGEVA